MDEEEDEEELFNDHTLSNFTTFDQFIYKRCRNTLRYTIRLFTVIRLITLYMELRGMPMIFL